MGQYLMTASAASLKYRRTAKLRSQSPKISDPTVQNQRNQVQLGIAPEQRQYRAGSVNVLEKWLPLWRTRAEVQRLTKQQHDCGDQ